MKDFIDKLISRLEDVIDGLEVYTAGRTNTLKVNMSVLQLQRYINRLKEINQLAEEYKPRTNADKIRSMDDEELAEAIFNCPVTESCPHWNDDVNCAKCVREWLQAEAKEGD